MVSTATRIAPAQIAPAETAEDQHEKLLTAEEFFERYGGKKAELIDGRIYFGGELINGKVVEEMPPGGTHGELAVDIAVLLKAFVRRHNLGKVYVETGFILERNPGKRDTVRSPDVSFVETARLPEGSSPRGFFEGAPTIAVEIVSPGDLWTKVEDKVRLYLSKGTRAVWIVEPDARTVTVRTADSTSVLQANETLDGGDALPGFQMPLQEIFE